MAAVLTARGSVAEVLAAKCVPLEECPALPDILESVPDPAGVFNKHRQLLLWNRAFERASNEDVTLLGRRPGDVLGCVNAEAGPEGCGSSPACASCGTARALSESLTQLVASSAECRIRTQSGKGFEFFVKASPLHTGAEPIAMAVFRDTGSEKRRELLERVFFHDLLNTASGIAGIAQILRDPELTHEDGDFFREQLSCLARHLVEEIQTQQRLSEAEAGNIAVRPSSVNVREVLHSVLTAHSADLPNRTIVAGDAPDICIWTDVVLLRKVLTNLLRNAIEASAQTDVVSVCCDLQHDSITFRIHNRAAIPEKLQNQIFQRSFTTKTDSGHGLGTYSAKLFTERYLGGRLSFQSAESTGTVFSVMLPLELR